MRKFTVGLTPAQYAIVMGVFMLTAIGAIVVALALRWWNKRTLRSRPFS